MGEQAILARVRRWTRIRNGLRAGMAALAVVLMAILVGRIVGTSLPGGVGWAIPALVVAGAIWPLAGDRLLLRAGRRLGVGERLAALDVLSRHGARALLSPLHAEIVAARPRGWRLVTGPVEYGMSALALGLALAVAFVPPLGVVSIPVGTDSPDGTLMGTVLSPEPLTETASPLPAEALSLYPSPAEIPAYSPYQDLLAAVLGLDEPELGGLSGDEVAARLAAEEGLLRQLAERIAAAAPGGLSPAERAELAPLAREVARPDLRERLQNLLDQEGEAAAREAAQAVEAVLEAAERASEESDSVSDGSLDSGPSTVPSSGTTAMGSVEGESAEGEVVNPSDVGGHDPLLDGEGEFTIPGLAGGGPLEPGPADGWGPTSAEEDSDVVRGGAGPMRAYVVPGIPGESPSGPRTDPVALSPQDVEVVLRAREIPVELRDLVRRYFELIGGNP